MAIFKNAKAPFIILISFFSSIPSVRVFEVLNKFNLKIVQPFRVLMAVKFAKHDKRVN